MYTGIDFNSESNILRINEKILVKLKIPQCLDEIDSHVPLAVVWGKIFSPIFPKSLRGALFQISAFSFLTFLSFSYIELTL